MIKSDYQWLVCIALQLAAITCIVFNSFFIWDFNGKLAEVKAEQDRRGALLLPLPDAVSEATNRLRSLENKLDQLNTVRCP